MYIVCASVCIYMACRDQKRNSDPQDLELGVYKHPKVGTGDLTRILYKQQISVLTNFKCTSQRPCTFLLCVLLAAAAAISRTCPPNGNSIPIKH